jgi:hypothetical protein
MRLPVNRRLGVSWIPAWVPSTATSSARPVVRVCRSVLDTLAISSWRVPCFTPVSHYTILGYAPYSRHSLDNSGFIVKVKKILECICVNCGKLKADIVSLPSLLGSFRSPPFQFSGGSPFQGTPSLRCVFLFFRPWHGPFVPARRSFTAGADDDGLLYMSGSGWTRGRVVKRGLNDRCKNRRLATRTPVLQAAVLPHLYYILCYHPNSSDHCHYANTSVSSSHA